MKDIKEFVEEIVDDASLHYHYVDENGTDFFNFYGPIRFREFSESGFTIATHQGKTTGHIIFIQHSYKEIRTDKESGTKKIKPFIIIEINVKKQFGKLLGNSGKVNFLDLSDIEYKVFSKILDISRMKLRKK